jgi:radical SAM superfamily enzyme YgiQ (UPF0313 family)
VRGCPRVFHAQVPLYDLPLFRPPSEADSLILQITIGCSHNRCSFCSMYRMKSFRAVPVAQIEQDIKEAAEQYGAQVRRVFLADGDAMCLSASRLIDVLDRVNAAFPHLQRIGIYANARDVLAKTDEQLAALRQRRLKVLYLGLESGDPETLAMVDKGATVDEIVQAVRRAQAADISASVMVLVGLAGRTRSQQHARASAEAINRMAPVYTALLTYTPTPGSPLMEAFERGQFELPDPMQSVQEIHTFVSEITCRTYFTCNHASNYLPLQGILPSARGAILAALQAAMDGRIGLKPEFLRGL